METVKTKPPYIEQGYTILGGYKEMTKDEIFHKNSMLGFEFDKDTGG